MNYSDFVPGFNVYFQFRFEDDHDQMVLLRNYLSSVICNKYKCMTSMANRRIKTVLVDLSGTVHIEDEEIPGSKDALKMYAFFF